MTAENDLRHALIAAFEHLKEQNALLLMMQCELAALRESVFEDNAQALVRFEELLALKGADALPEIANSSQVFDSIVQLLKGGAAWLN